MPPDTLSGVPFARVLRLAAAGAVVAVLLGRFGTHPFAQAVHDVTGRAILVAAAVTVLTTVCCAWRWSWTARRLGLRLPLRTAVLAYYRSQFLNQTLPGGVLGDVHRALHHGAETRAVPGAARAVAWERAVGQVALLALTGVAVVLLPRVMPPMARTVTVCAILVALAVAAVSMASLRWRTQRLGRLTGVLMADVRKITGRQLWLPVLLSVAAVAGHVLVLFTAMRAAGVDSAALTSVPLLLMVLVGSSLPLNLAGWGPREGVAAWLFGAAGAGAEAGVTVAAVYGILAFVAALPGAALVLMDTLPGWDRAVRA